MTVTVDEALDQLNIESLDDQTELELYVDAANEWIANKVTDTDTPVVRLATLFLIDHLWASQRGPAAIPIGDEIVTVSGRGYAIPNRVLELLGIYLTAVSPTGSFPDASSWPDPVERG